jgi:hypothetical protein
VASIWEALRANFYFASVRGEEPRIACLNCDQDAQATNIDQVVKWAKRHLKNCPGLIEESDAEEIGFTDININEIQPHVTWYEAKEILSDE